MTVQPDAPAPDVGGYWTTEEAAELMRVHVETVRRYLRRGLLVGYPLPGGGYRIPHGAVTALLLRPRQP